jgi:putative aldouronate transport system permease protein
MLHARNLPDRLTDALIYAGLILVGLAMFFPFLYVFSNSFSTVEEVARGGVILWPKQWSTNAYEVVLQSRVLRQAMGVSVFLATAGTFVQLALTAMMAYALASPHLIGRRFLLIMVIIPILYWPGMIPRFLVVKTVGLMNSIWALIIPSAVRSFELIIMRNAFMELPPDIRESAEIDGANDLQILWHLVLPLSTAMLAAIGLFYAVANWNSYFAAILYLNDSTKWPIQIILRQIILLSQNTFGHDVTVEAPTVSLQMATIMVATMPILMAYPFLQRYFTKGVLTGAIKG